MCRAMYVLVIVLVAAAVCVFVVSGVDNLTKSSQVTKDSFTEEINHINTYYSRKYEQEHELGQANGDWDERRKVWRKSRHDAVRDCYMRHGREIPEWLNNVD